MKITDTTTRTICDNTIPPPPPPRASCPRTRPHDGPHVWRQERRSPIFGRTVLTFTCKGKHA